MGQTNSTVPPFSKEGISKQELDKFEGLMDNFSSKMCGKNQSEVIIGTQTNSLVEKLKSYWKKKPITEKNKLLIIDLLRFLEERQMLQKGIKFEDHFDYKDKFETKQSTIIFANVKKNESPQTVAIKKIRLPTTEMFREPREIKSFASLNHPNLMKPHYFFIDYNRFMCTCDCYMVMPDFEFDMMMWLLNEFNTRNPNPMLFSPKSCKRRLDEIIFVFSEILKGLEYLHKENIIHSDLKFGNVLINCAENKVVLTDLGFCKNVNDMTENIGLTMGFCAPEVLECCDYINNRFKTLQTSEESTARVPHQEIQQYLTPKADIFSFGVMLFIIFVGNLEENSSTNINMIEPSKVKERIASFTSKQLPSPELVNGLCEIIKTCLSKNPKDRPSSTELMNHPFFQETSKTPTKLTFGEYDRAPPIQVILPEPIEGQMMAIDDYFPTTELRSKFKAFAEEMIAKNLLIDDSSRFDVVQIGLGKRDIILVRETLKSSGKQIKAIKRILRPWDSDSFREPAIMSSMNHENVVKMDGVFFEKSDIHVQMEMFIVMPYIKYDFLSWLCNSNEKASESYGHSQIHYDCKRNLKEVRSVLKQVLCGLQHIHSKNLIHLDIKFDNILVDENDHAYIIDFGQAFVNLTTATTIGGTTGFFPPEILDYVMNKHAPSLTPKADIFSFGVILYHLFVDNTHDRLDLRAISVQTIKSRMEGVFSTLANDWIVEDLATLIRNCLLEFPEDRPSAQQLLEDFKFFSVEEKEFSDLKVIKRPMKMNFLS